MSVVLLVVGLLITAAGFVTIGFGIPINAFSLGNTLIISGTVAVSCGLILIGISMAVRQLTRIAAALRGQAVMPKAVRSAAEAPAGEGLVPPTARLTPVAQRQPAAPPPAAPSFIPPPRPVEAATPSMPRQADYRMSEQRVAAPPAEEEKGPLQWLRSKKSSAPSAAPAQSAAPSLNEPSMLDVADEAPLSPRPPRLPFTTPPMAAEPSYEPKVEPRGWAPGRDAGELKPVSRNEQIPRVAPQIMPQADPAKDKMFDVVWPDGKHTPPPVVPEPAAKREVKVEMPAPPPMPTMRREEPVADQRAAELPLAPAADRTPAVLKSGVIDGMAYTLYADGSIEADLQNGIVKFASVDALRAHLEKQT